MEESTCIRVQAAYCQWNICDGILYMGENTHTNTHTHTRISSKARTVKQRQRADTANITFEGLQEC